MKSGAMPMPWSRMLTSMTPLRDTLVTAISPPSGEYFTALLRRFPMTCAIRSGSHWMIGSSGSRCVTIRCRSLEARVLSAPSWSRSLIATACG